MGRYRVIYVRRGIIMSQYFLTTCHQSALSVAQIMPQRKTKQLILYYHFLRFQCNIPPSIGLCRYESDNNFSVNFKMCSPLFECYRYLYFLFIICFSPFNGVNSSEKLSIAQSLYLETDQFLIDYG